MKVCTCEQMRKIDADTEKIGGIPSIVLMENAAMACVRELEKIGIVGKRIAVFCGKGNNGGDGFAIARHLSNMGAKVCVYLVCGNEYKGDALINYEIIKRMGIKIVDSEDINPEYAVMADIIVDAIFGTGVRGEISSLPYDVISAVNNSGAYTLSVDIPSGANGNTGEVCGICVKADKTVTFGAYKCGMLMFPACDYNGEVVVSGISIPENIIDSQGIKINVTDKITAKNMMPKRCENSHKGDYGKVLIIGGSKGMTGAPTLSAQSALASGAGLVTVGIPESLNEIMEIKLTEAMTVPLKDKNGSLTLESIDEIKDRIKKCDAVLFGPGIGREEHIRHILSEILKSSDIPVIIDADGLNALSGDMSILNDAKCEVILTPHTVEMSRMTNISPEKIEGDRIGVSSAFVREYKVTLVLKGHHTIVTGLDGVQYINITGNSGMATGGSGDVLAGMIAAFAARGLSPTDAASLAVYLHGAAGDIARDRVGADSMLAHSITDNIPYAIMGLK